MCVKSIFFKAIFAVAVLFFYAFTLSAQIRITGVVNDDTGGVLPGVNVTVRGTATGSATDANGMYSIAVPDGNAVLVFSFVGFATQEIIVGNQRMVNVVLAEGTELDEVVVVGYGTVKKSDLTGSVSSVTSRSFLDQPGSAGNSVLTGRVPGLVVRRSNGAPDEQSTLRIRGINSILGNNDPLIVVDGNYSSMPNMYDIESIEILKDASATAIYGSRGANGVIIITTKRGSSEGRNEVKLYSNLSFAHIPQNWRYDMMDAMEYAEYANAASALMNNGPIYGDETLERIRREGGTDWQDELFQTGLSQNYKAVISGGNNKMRYYITPTYNQIEGVIINSAAKNYSLGAKFDADLNSRVSYQVEANIFHGERLNPNFEGRDSHEFTPLGAALSWSPIPKVYNDDGTFVLRDDLASSTLNPIAATTLEDTRYSNNADVVGNIRVKIIDGLTFDGKAFFAFGTGGQRYFRPGIFYNNQPNARQNNSENQTWLLNAFLTYTKTLAEKHNLSFMLGFEETQSHARSFSADGNNLSIETQKYDNLSLGRTISIESSYSNNALRSYFARGTYNYDGRYYFTGTFRADGSSKFRKENQFSYFPSFGAAWRLSEESFMKDNVDIFQNLKLRGSWGITGSQAVGAYATYGLMGGSSYTWGTSTLYRGYGPGAPVDPLLQWEETTSTDLGIDITTLNGKLTLAFDWYLKQTDKLLSRINVPLYNGGGTVTSNLGSVENRGFEINLNYLVIENSDWSYDINLNGAHNQNKVLDIGDQERIWASGNVDGAMAETPYIIMPGQPIGTIFGYRYLGIWQENEKAEAAKFTQYPGHYRYKDLDRNYSYGPTDYEIIGCSNPKFTWGFNNHLSWKNWDMNVLVEGLHGRDIINLTYMLTTSAFDNSKSVKARDGKDRWTLQNPNAKFSALPKSPPSTAPEDALAATASRIQSNSDQWIQDGSYVKIRNISLSYRFPKSMIRVADARLSLSAQNVFTFTKYKGYDPEVSAIGGDAGEIDAGSGIDWFAYPNPRTITVSLSVEF